ncbi:malignant T-cell-amplified sequence 1 protein [Pelomyxa schiedti]|nr:malignant T-cell-amplified sequence 1 protein [Pelomyxa schiedti]
MLKKFDKEEISGTHQPKTSVQRGIRSAIVAACPAIEPYLNDIWPKKQAVALVKCHNHIQLIAVNGDVLFFSIREGSWVPTLRLLHKYPFVLPKFQVDKGAIKFVMSGAQIMCPGLTSPGGRMEEVPTDTFVAIMAEGKEHALGIGLTKLSSAEIRTVNKGVGVDNVHFLNDGLWVLNRL